jgi:hypothetical protein
MTFGNLREAKIALLLGTLAIGGSLIASCGGDENSGEPTEIVRSKLGSSGSWSNAGGILLASPALAKGPSTTLTAFGWGTDSQIWTTAQNPAGQGKPLRRRRSLLGPRQSDGGASLIVTPGLKD